jgi:hypothetical protein
MATTYPGYGGLMVVGGILDGSPLINGALASSLTTLALDGVTAGVILGGDTFTIAGETGSPTHTVTAGLAFLVANTSLTGLTFTPAIATGGVADNAAITFTSNSVAQMGQWELTVKRTVHKNAFFGEKWEGTIGGLASASGRCEGWLDLSDAKQSALASNLVATTPIATPIGLVFRYATSKNIYLFGVPQNAKVSAPVNGLVTVAFAFTADGTVLTNLT